MASGRALEHLFEADPHAYDVTLFGAADEFNVLTVKVTGDSPQRPLGRAQ